MRFRVWGLYCLVGLGFRASWFSGFGVLGLAFRVSWLVLGSWLANLGL